MAITMKATHIQCVFSFSDNGDNSRNDIHANGNVYQYHKAIINDTISNLNIA